MARLTNLVRVTPVLSVRQAVLLWFVLDSSVSLQSVMDGLAELVFSLLCAFDKTIDLWCGVKSQSQLGLGLGRLSSDCERFNEHVQHVLKICIAVLAVMDLCQAHVAGERVLVAPSLAFQAHSFTVVLESLRCLEQDVNMNISAWAKAKA